MQRPQPKLISGSDDLSLFEEYFDHFFTRDSVVAVVLEQGQDLPPFGVYDLTAGGPGIHWPSILKATHPGMSSRAMVVSC